MSRQKKNGCNKTRDKVILATAILTLIKALVELIKALIE